MRENYEDSLPGMSEREMFESMHKYDLLETIISMGEKVTQIEKSMDLAARVMQEQYGKSVEVVLAEKEKEYGEKQV